MVNGTDVTSGYFNVKLDEASRKYTAFTVNGIQYCYKVLPFGLRISGQMFIKCLENSLSEETKRNSSVYVDDIVIGSPTWKQHMVHLEQLFKDIRVSGIKLNFEKTRLARAEVEFVGHLVSAEGVKPLEDKLRIIQKLEKPRNIKQLRRFIGMISFYRKFVRKFSQLIYPLNELLKKNVKWKWDVSHQYAFEKIKEAFQRCIVLQHPDVTKPYVVRCDASGSVIAAILSQEHDKGEKLIIEVTSRCLNEHERNYSVTEVELLAVLHAIKKWRHYLLGSCVTVKTDHQALCCLNKGTGLNARLTRWAIVLGEYNLKVEYVKGKDNAKADCLSRPVSRERKVIAEDKFLVGIFVEK